MVARNIGTGPFTFVRKIREADGTISENKVTRRFESMDQARAVLYQGACEITKTAGLELAKNEPETLIYRDLDSLKSVTVVILYDPTHGAHPVSRRA